VHEVLVKAAAAIALAFFVAGGAVAAGAEIDPRAPRSIMRGTVTIESGNATFRTCGDKGRDYLLVDASRETELTRLYAELAPRAGVPVFMELRGVVVSAPADARIDRAVHAEAIERAEREGPGCRRPINRFDALVIGSSPAWQVEISRAGVTFAAIDPPGMKIFPPYAGEWPAAGGVRYDGKAESGVLSIVLEPMRCRDAVTGNLYSLAARVQFNGTEYRGCAFRGRAGAATSAAAR
jgi:uncharacterized membrane protein